MMKRMLSVLLTLVLVLTMIPGAGSAFAEDTAAAANQEAAGTEPAAGAEVRYSTDGGETWTEDSLKGALTTLYESSTTQGDSTPAAESVQTVPVKIELLRDITLDGSWKNDGQDLSCNGKTVVLDGMGFTIRRGEDAQKITLFSVCAGGNVTLTNITIDGGAVWDSSDPAARVNSGIKAEEQLINIYDDGSTLTLDCGTILQNNDMDAEHTFGGAVRINSDGSSNGKLILKEGAAIKDNHAMYGGAVSIGGEGSIFQMEGGTISGNYAGITGIDYSGSTGGVRVEKGSFIMNGGKIFGNASDWDSGGVAVFQDGTFTMNGGTIENNKAVIGGGIYIAGTAFLNGGSVTGNSITGSFEGGGLTLWNTASLTVSGTPTVTGNTAKDSAANNSAANNVFLYEGATITVSDEKVLSEGALLGVTTDVTPTETAPVNVTGAGTADYSRFFTSDSNLYEIKNKAENTSNTVQLTAKELVTITFDKNDGSSEPETKEQRLAVGFAGKLEANSFAREGYVFMGWNTAADGSGMSYEDQAVVSFNGNTTLYAYWTRAVVIPPAPSGGGYVHVVIEKPIIEADEGADVSLGILGTTADIEVKEGFELTDVTVNGVSKGIVERLTGLKTGDKVVVTTKAIVTEPTDADRIAALKEIRLVARSRMSQLRGDKAVRVHWYDQNGADLDDFGFDGYEVWRSLKRYEGYGNKPFFTTEKTHYYNNLIKAGNKYYYRVRGYILVDGEKYYTDWSLKAWRTVK